MHGNDHRFHGAGSSFGILSGAPCAQDRRAADLGRHLQCRCRRARRGAPCPTSRRPPGRALFAGAGGSLLFGAVGFLAAIPFLLRIHRRTGTWGTPAVLLALFALIFSISTFVVGPAITTSPSKKSSPASEQTGQPTTPRSTQKDIHGH